MYLGTFQPYDIDNNPTAPKTKGFLGGISLKDNVTKQYVGYGPSCNRKYANMPCYILTTNASKGCYVSCEKEVRQSKSIFYLKSHEKLNWKETNVNTMINVKGTIKFSSKGFPFMFGRIMSEGNYRLGIIHAMDGFYQFEVQGSNNTLTYTEGFEILTCS